MTRAKTIQLLKLTTKELRDSKKIFEQEWPQLPKEFQEFFLSIPTLEQILDKGYRILKDTTNKTNYEIREILIGGILSRADYSSKRLEHLLPLDLKDKKKVEAGKKSAEARKKRKGGFNTMSHDRLVKVSHKGGIGATSEDKSHAAEEGHFSKLDKIAADSVGEPWFQKDVDEKFAPTITTFRIKLEEVEIIRHIAIEAEKIKGEIEGTIKDGYATEFKAVPLLVKS